MERLSNKHLSPDIVNPFLTARNEAPVKSGVSLADLLRRPAITYRELAPLDAERPALSRAEVLTVETELKYAGYVAKQLADIERNRKMEEKRLPPDLDYNGIQGLRIEAAQKLSAIRPLTVGQASRISGVSPADISVLLIYLGWK
jgi:tRNA uridine 5-carboxymethylaminomethyl modification enzyme